MALCEDARAKKQEQIAGLVPPLEVLAILRRVLGSLVIFPPRLTPDFMGYVGRRVKFLGVDEDDLERAAIRVREEGKARPAEYIIRYLDSYLGNSGQEEPVETELETGRLGE